jgi:hypothetical protein
MVSMINASMRIRLSSVLRRALEPRLRRAELSLL